MKNMAKVLGDMLEPGAQTHPLCSAVNSNLWCVTLALERMEVQVSTSENFEHSDFESKQK